MKLVVLASATDDAAARESEEGRRYAHLKSVLGAQGVQIDAAFNLLGRHDYLLVLEIDGGPEDAFRAMSTIAQSGTMRTESFVAMPLESYFAIAADVGGERSIVDHSNGEESARPTHANAEGAR